MGDYLGFLSMGILLICVRSISRESRSVGIHSSSCSPSYTRDYSDMVAQRNLQSGKRQKVILVKQTAAYLIKSHGSAYHIPVSEKHQSLNPFAILPMLGGAMAGVAESVSEYYSSAKLSGAPPSTLGIISRGLGV